MDSRSKASVSRFARWIGTILRVFAGALLLVIIFGGLFTLTRPGLDIAARQVSSIASNDDQSIEISGLSGIWTGRFRTERISIADRNGIWASISDVEVDWSPLALFSGKFEADRIRAGTVEIIRQPLPTKDQNEEIGGGGLPLELEIRSLVSDRILIGEAVAGIAATLELGGSLFVASEPVQMAGEINISRIDGANGTASLEFNYRPTAQDAAIRFLLREERDGLIANALQLPERPSTSFEVRGRGPLTEWAFDAEAQVDGGKILRIGGVASLTETRQRIELRGNGQPDKLSPPAYRALLGGGMELEIDASRYSDGRIEIEKARADFGQFFVAATGFLDPKGDTRVSGGLSAKQAAVNLKDIVPGLDNLAPKDIAFSIEGTDGKAKIEASLDVPLIDAGNLAVTGLRARLFAPTFDVGARSGNFSLEAETESFIADQPDLQRLLGSPAYLTMSGTLDENKISVEELALDNREMSISSKGAFTFEPLRVQIQPLVQIRRGGLPDQAQKLVTDVVNLSADVAAEITPELSVEISDASIDTGIMSGAAAFRLANGEISTQAEVDIPDLAAVVEESRGNASLNLAAEGPIEAPTIEFGLESSAIAIGQRELSGISASIKGLADIENPDLKFELAGAIDGLPVTGSGQLLVKDGQRHLEDFQIENGANRIVGALTFDDRFIPNGTIEFSLPELAPLAALVLQEAQGSLTGSTSFQKEGQMPIVNLAARADALTISGNQINGLSLSIRAKDYLAVPGIDGEASAESIVAGSTVITRPQLDLTNAGSVTDFEVTASADSIPIDVKGRLRSETAGPIVELERAKTTYRDIGIALRSPTTIPIANGSASLSDLAIGVGQGTVTVSGRAGQTLDLAIELSSINASLANSFSPGLGAQGNLSGSAIVTGEASDPVVDFSLALGGARSFQTQQAGLPPVNVRTTGRFRSKTVTFDTNLDGSDGLALNASGDVSLDSGPAFDIAVNGGVPFALLAAKLAENGIALSGAASAQMQIRGTPTSPSINGSVRSSGARLVHAPSGIAIDDLATEINLQGDAVRIASLTGNLSTGGRVQAAGTVSLNGASGYPAELSLRVADGVYADGKTVNAEFNADLALSGPLTGQPVIGGEVRMGKTIVTVPNTIPVSISRLNVQHRNADAAVRAQAENFSPTEPASSNSSGLGLDVVVSAPNQIFVRGRGIDAELGGRLRLQGPVSSPGARGGFELRRGRLDLLGRRLDFTSGTMGFAGSLIPELDISAQALSGDTTVIVRIVGPANAPEFRFSSSPPLSEDEVLARLIFNRDLASLSALQIAQLAQAAATLAGKGGDSSVLTKLQDSLGIDDIDIRTDAQTGEATVGIGKRINDRTYIGVEQGQGAGTGKATIDLDIGRGVKLRGEASESGQSKAGIFYEREY